MGYYFQFVALMLVLASAFWACGSDFVQIDFEVPMEYRDQVETVSIRIVTPSSIEPFTCEDVALGSVSTNVLIASTVSEVVSVDTGHIDVSGIPRNGTKLIIAMGLDNQALPIVAACAFLGDIEEPLTVKLDVEPSSVVVVPEIPFGEPFPDTLTITISDVFAQALADTLVQWTVVGPAPTEESQLATGQTRTDENGTAQLSFSPITQPGPMILDIDTRWERVSGENIAGFREPVPVLEENIAGDHTLARAIPTESRYQVGRIGPQGQPGFAALLLPQVEQAGHRVYLAYYDSDTREFRSAISSPIAGIFALGLITPASNQDQIIALSSTNWVDIRISSIPAVEVFSTPLTPPPGAAATAIFPASSCQNAPDVDAVLVASGTGLRTYDASRTEIAGLFSGEPATTRVLAAGCVADITGISTRTVVVRRDEQNIPTLLAGNSVVREGALEGVLTSGIGFAQTTPVLDTLLATDVSVQGTSVGRYQLLAGDDTVTGQLITQDDIASVPLSSQGGQLDGDNTVDIISLLNFGIASDFSETRTRIFVALGRLYEGARVVGISKEFRAVRPRLWIADFDRDSIDDVLIGAPGWFRVYLFGSTGSE